MSDVFSKIKRSAIMSRIRGRGNKSTERALAIIFRRNVIAGWRRNQNIFGKPDFVFLKRKVVVFVDGCFWHNCPKHGTQPATNRAFWEKKLARNKLRDQVVNR